MAPSKTAPKSASPMSTATTRFDFFSLSRTITNKPYTNFFFFFIRANLLIDSIRFIVKIVVVVLFRNWMWP